MAEPNVIALLRVSTDAQDVARQRADLERIKTKFGISVSRVLELVGVSGTATLEDSQVQQVLTDLQLQEIDGIALSALDRLFRPGKRYGQFSILDRFVDQRKRIWSMREGLIDPATDEGYDKCISAGGRAGAEWRELIRRTHDGRIEHLRAGKLDHGAAPFGYIYIPKWQANGCRFEIHPERAQVVRDIFEWRRGGMPIYQIAKRLNEAGILSTNGGLWSRRVILQTLEKPTYKGEHQRFGITIPCPAIIDRETWEDAQRVTAESRSKHVGRPSRKYLLRGLIWCARCGRRCITFPNHDRPFYRCGNFVAKPPFQRQCHAPSVTQSVIEAAAWTEIWRTLTDPGLLLKLARAYYDSQEKPAGTDGIETKLARLRNKLATTQAMVQDNILDYALGRAEIRALQAEIREQEVELRNTGKILGMPPAAAAESAVREITQGIQDGIEPVTYESRRAILDGIVDLRLSYDSGELTIEGKIPVPAESTSSGQKNCDRRIDADPNSFVSIPFILKKRVA